MANDRKQLPTRPAPGSEVERFLSEVAAAPTLRAPGTRGRLVFAMDATASREPTWDRACRLQAEMFRETEALGGLDVQLVFYRGFGECKASRWHSEPATLRRAMTAVTCLGGQTQIGKVLRHVLTETRRQKVNALVFVGDAFEEEIDTVCAAAGELGVLGVPAFMFHEGRDPIARKAFEQVARLTGGACCPFDASSAQQLRDLLRAVAVFAAGGRPALEHYGRRHGGEAARLSAQLKSLPRSGR